MAQAHFMQCQHCLAHTSRPIGWHVATSTCPACLVSEQAGPSLAPPGPTMAPAWTLGAVELPEPARDKSPKAGPVKPRK